MINISFPLRYSTTSHNTTRFGKAVPEKELNNTVSGPQPPNQDGPEIQKMLNNPCLRTSQGPLASCGDLLEAIQNKQTLAQYTTPIYLAPILLWNLVKIPFRFLHNFLINLPTGQPDTGWGMATSEDTSREALYDLVSPIACPGVHMHSFRHQFINQLYRKAGPEVAKQKIEDKRSILSEVTLGVHFLEHTGLIKTGYYAVVDVSPEAWPVVARLTPKGKEALKTWKASQEKI